MLIAAEVLILLYIGWITVRIMRNDFTANLLRIFAIILGCVGATFASVAAGWCTRSISSNFMLEFIVSAFFAVAAYFVIVHIAVKKLDRWRDRRGTEDKAWRLLPRVLGRPLNGFLVILLLCSVILILDLLVGLADLSPLSDRVRDRTLYLRYLLPLRDSQGQLATGTAGDDQLHDVMDRQAKFLSSLHSGFLRSKISVADELGTQAAVRDVVCLVELLNLPANEIDWVIKSTPELRALTDNKQLLKVMNDDQVMDLIIRVSEGSLKAVYQLGDQECIRVLLEDEEVKNAVTAINLQALRDKVSRHRRETERVLAVPWEVAEIGSPLELDATLQEPSRWKRVDASDKALSWPPDTRFALVRTMLAVTKQTEVKMCLASAGPATLWMKGQGFEFKSKRDRKECDLTFPAGNVGLVLMVDLRTVNPPKTCKPYIVLR